MHLAQVDLLHVASKKPLNDRNSSTAILLFASSFDAESKHFGLGSIADRRIHDGLLQRTIQLALQVDVDLVIARRGEIDVPGAHQTFEQRGSTFDERMRHALDVVDQAGYQRVVVIGGDTPSLSLDDLERACRRRDIVVGPSTDGGFYLLGIDVADRALGCGLPWHTDTVLAALRRRLSLAGRTILYLSCRDDVDDARDVQRQLAQLYTLIHDLFGVDLRNSLSPATPTPLYHGVLREAHQRTAPSRGPPIL